MKASPSLDEFLRPIAELLALPEVTELCINRPGEAFVETRMGWTRHELPALTFSWAQVFAITTAASNDRWVDGQKTLLSAELPGGERIFIVYPPSCESGTISITIRKPSSASKLSNASLVNAGLYRRVKKSITELDPFEEELLQLYQAADYDPFMQLAVKMRRNIVVSGATSSGKTTYTNALFEFIDPNDRIITIEDTRELRLPNQLNHVHLLYESDGAGKDAVSPAQLVRASKRMRPDRILNAEIRGEEAYDLLVGVNSAHPGTITSTHAETALGVADVFAAMIEGGGRKLSRENFDRLFYGSVDIICQFNTAKGPSGAERGITEIYYDPKKKRKARAG